MVSRKTKERHAPLKSLRLPNYACALFIVPLLAFALASPAGAEPASNPPERGDWRQACRARGQTANPPSAGGQAQRRGRAACVRAAKPGLTPAKPKPKSAAAPLDGKSAGAGSQILINIDKSLQEMTVFVDGIEKYQWPVSTGKRGYSTPSGTILRVR